LKEKPRLRVFGKWVLKKIFEDKEKEEEVGEKGVMKSLTIFTPCQIYLNRSNKKACGGRCKQPNYLAV
jgi:hypothetical protein